LILEGLHDLPFGQDGAREKIMNALPQLAALTAFGEKESQFWQYIVEDDSFFLTPQLHQVFHYLIMHLRLFDSDLILRGAQICRITF